MMQCSARRLISIMALIPAVIAGAVSASAADWPHPGTVVLQSGRSFNELSINLEEAVKSNGFAVVTTASASAGAAARGVTIPGNRVVGVFRNDYAVRMLAASVPAGIEAPLRFYLLENADGTSILVYRKPSAVFASYGVPALDAMAGELDPIWDRIATNATR